MASTQVDLDKKFLADLSRGGFAESLTPDQRRAIHIRTELDEFLETQVTERGRQVVLTGNPGDGKTQHILQHQDSDGREEVYYLLDASEYADYGNLLEEWASAYNAGKPGILAINDGPLHEITADYRAEFDFLDDVQIQLENQLVYDRDDEPTFDTNDVLVVDLNNRTVLTPRIIREAIETFADELARKGHDHAGTCHIQYNAKKLLSDGVQKNMVDLLLNVGQLDVHITVRDLINFLCFTLTGGFADCRTDFDEELKYYNLAFHGEGQLFDLVRRRLGSEQLTHPFIDSRLWAAAEEEVDPRDIEDAREEIEAIYGRLKRRFIFEDATMDIGYESRLLFTSADEDFISHRNTSRSGNAEARKEEFIRRLNRYFEPRASTRSEVKIWISHNYRSKNSLALVSRTAVPKRDFALKSPRLHSAIENAIGFTPNHTVLEYTGGDRPVRLTINRDLYRRLNALAGNVPYTLRNRENEQRILEFMEEIEYHASYSETNGEIDIKDTETGRVESVEVRNELYRV